jgi:hypothetical protein
MNVKASQYCLLLALGSASVWANQSCDTQSYPLSTPTGRFTDNKDGTLTDQQSGLTWMRCSLGQQWNGENCQGEPSAYTWQAAQAAAAQINQTGGFASHSDWRMPHIPELAMIVERQCDSPRINLTLFPNTPANYFWTATGRGGLPAEFRSRGCRPYAQGPVALCAAGALGKQVDEWGDN